MVMRGSGRTLKRLAALVVLSALTACASGPNGLQSGSTPSEDAATARLGSRAGNYLAGRFAQNQHDMPAASAYLLRALALDPDNTELLQRAYLALAVQGNLGDSALIAQHLLRYDREAAIAAMLLAEQDMKAGDYAGAEKRVSQLPRRGLNSFMVPVIVAWARVGQNNYDGALEALQPLSQITGFAALHDFHAALINDLADRRKAADQAYRSVLAGNGGLTLRSVEAASSFYRRIGQPDKAMEVLKRYQDAHPDSSSVLEEAPAERPVNDARAGLAEVFFGASGSLRQGNAPELALIFGRLALDLNPNMPLAQLSVGDLLQSLGLLGDANAIYAAIDAKSPVSWTSQLRIAANQDDLGQTDASVATLESLATLHPDRSEPLITLGDVLRRHKRWAEAVVAYDRALALIPDPPKSAWGLFYARGIALERSKNWTRAESDFLKALEMEPDEPYVLNYLGYSWIEQGINLEQARKMIEKAVEQRPTDGFIVDSLGWVLYRSGDYPRAVEFLQRAVELHPEDATLNDHLGDALWRVGRIQEAKFQWQRALISNPEDDQKDQLQRKLQTGLPAAAPTITKPAAHPPGRKTPVAQ